MEHPLFVDAPVERFDSIVLRSQGSRSWQDFRDPEQALYLRDAFARDTARDMGEVDGHATFVHLDLNGLYWGLYNPVDRPDARFGAECFGGSPDDYVSIHQYTSNRDGPEEFQHNNMRGIRRREPGAGFRFFVWWSTASGGADDHRNIDVDVPGSASHVYAMLRASEQFRAVYDERASLHLTGGGALAPEACLTRWQARTDEIFDAVLAESARWGDTDREVPYTRDVEWIAEQALLVDEHFPFRTDVLIGQLVDAGLMTAPSP